MACHPTMLAARWRRRHAAWAIEPEPGEIRPARDQASRHRSRAPPSRHRQVRERVWSCRRAPRRHRARACRRPPRAAARRAGPLRPAPRPGPRQIPAMRSTGSARCQLDRLIAEASRRDSVAVKQREVFVHRDAPAVYAQRQRRVKIVRLKYRRILLRILLAQFVDPPLRIANSVPASLCCALASNGMRRRRKLRSTALIRPFAAGRLQLSQPEPRDRPSRAVRPCVYSS